MTLTKDTNILIVGLGLIGGSYAKALTKRGFRVTAITKNTDEAIAYFATFTELQNMLQEENIEGLREAMCNSTARRALFNKK